MINAKSYCWSLRFELDHTWDEQDLVRPPREHDRLADYGLSLFDGCAKVGFGSVYAFSFHFCLVSGFLLQRVQLSLMYAVEDGVSY